MKVKRKILAAALACIMTVGFIPTNALAAIDVPPSANADVSARATLDGDGPETNPYKDEALTEEISREQTVIPAVNPADYSFTVKYVDGEGNSVPGGGTITFDETGAYSREDIPLPYGYMQIIPAHPDDDWLYPTALEFIDGVWTVTNPVVEIMVEPMAKVDIVFKTPDGETLEDFGSTKYYDSIGAGIETVTAPEGYEFIEGNTYAVDVTRDENGKLVADPAEVVFWVKAAGTEIPVNPSDYSFTVKYVDGEGNPIQGGGTITFEKAGSYSREDIPLPYGYMQIIPAHPDEDWLYPTALEFANGKWIVTNSVVEIMVEPMAKVDIIFKTSDGEVLEDFGYTKYYDSIGAGIETVTAPEGYEFIEGNTYAVDVTRDENGKLVADPAEVVFWVKAEGTEVPVNPSDYFFNFRFVDGEGNLIGGGTIYFDKTGPYSREEIELPDGYMQMIPAHPGEDWLYPTALEWKNGEWFVTNMDVEIMVEPMAKVDIIFKTPDGKVLEDLSYTKYYDSIGAGIETVTAPEGYEFVGENTYAVDVTRDENSKLVADPTEVEFVVKAIGSGEPSDPTRPGDDTQGPKTGDSSNLNLWVAFMIVSAGAVVVVLMAKYRRKAAGED